MARISDVPRVIRKIGLWTFGMRIWSRIEKHHSLVWASAGAYSWLFSIFPFLIFLLTLLPYLPQYQRESASKSVNHLIYETLGAKAAPTVVENLKAVMQNRHTGLLSIGLIVTLFVSSSGMVTTMSALDEVFGIEKGRAWYTRRSIAIALTLVSIIIVLLVVVLLPAATILESWLVSHGFLSPAAVWLLDIGRISLAIIFLLVFVSLTYCLGPSARQHCSLLSPGALFCVAVWIVLDTLFRSYITRFSRYDQTYGAVGGVAIILLFFYIDSLVLLIGAEIDAELNEVKSKEVSKEVSS